MALAARRYCFVHVALAVALGGCEDERPRRTMTHPAAEEPTDAGIAGTDGGIATVLGDFDPSVTLSDPRDIGTSVCPGVRLFRIDRRHAGAPASAPPLAPRFFGRTEYGQLLSLRDVLLCELRIKHWTRLSQDEGAYLIMWRGPFIFEPDGDCDWREPFHSERTGAGRALHFHEHCRRRTRALPSDRPITIEVDDTYINLTER